MATAMCHLSRNYFTDDIKQSGLCKVTQQVSIQSGTMMYVWSGPKPWASYDTMPSTNTLLEVLLKYPFPDPRACYSPRLFGWWFLILASFHFLFFRPEDPKDPRIYLVLTTRTPAVDGERSLSKGNRPLPDSRDLRVFSICALVWESG